ncbi:MAG: hypothetical protein CL607_14725 [Anaerolineaceae bacterium]|nr:hypothetical protein [Anaerolineaceae bacterium]
MASSKSTLRIPAAIDQIRRAVLFVATSSQRMGMGTDGAHQVQIAVEEIITNIVEHGYRADPQSAVIDIAVEREGQQVIITITDDAPLFNPLLNTEPDPHTPLEDRKTGGWGVYFVKQYVDAVHYRAASNRNQITLIKKIAN